MNNIQKISDEIRRYLGCGYTHYFSVEDSRGNKVKIRVSDHSANRQNNSGETLSFITNRTKQKKSGYNQMVNEWVILDEGYTDTYETLEQILENELN